MTMTFFEQVGPRGRVREVLNVLLEAPFFYPEDDPELFAFLRRNRAELGRFFDEAFGWQLIVESRVARVYKPRWHNAALKRSQHEVFTLTRRDECIAFLLLLDLHEEMLEARGTSIDDVTPLRFEMGRLFAHARQKLGRAASVGAGEIGAGESGAEVEASDDVVDDERIRRMFRELLPQLLRHRFLKEVPSSDAAPERATYECLAGLSAYDVRALGDEVVSRALADGRDA